MEKSTSVALWESMKAGLEVDVPDWEKRINEDYIQVRAIIEHAKGKKLLDHEVYRGLVLSVLSSNTDWAKVQPVVPELDRLFDDFSLKANASENGGVDEKVRWFESKLAGSPQLRKGLTRLVAAAQRLLKVVGSHGSLDAYLNDLTSRWKGDIPSVAVALGYSSSPDKLPGLGIPLAAEFLKNVGYDVAKPDRHINRATGSFGWVSFRNWPDRTNTKSPTANKREFVNVMRAMAEFSGHVGKLTAYVDNALWLLCAKGGAYLNNDALKSLRK